MHVQIIYSSLSGRTEKLAKSLWEEIGTVHTCIRYNLKDGEPKPDGDIILLGYWVAGGKPDKAMEAYMKQVEGKAVGVFCTLGAYADSAHAVHAIANGVNLVKEKNTVIGSFVCSGAVSDSIRNSYREKGDPALAQKEIRWDIMKQHPTKAECSLAAERFLERIAAYERHREQHLPFESVLPE